MNEKFSFAYIDKVEAENAELKRQIEQMKKTYMVAIDNATKISSIELSIAERLKRESSPEALESERAANAILTEENEQLKRLIMLVINAASLLLENVELKEPTRQDLAILSGLEEALLETTEFTKDIKL